MRCHLLCTPYNKLHILYIESIVEINRRINSVVEHLPLINIHFRAHIHKSNTHMTTNWIHNEQHHSDLPRDETLKQYKQT